MMMPTIRQIESHRLSPRAGAGWARWAARAAAQNRRARAPGPVEALEKELDGVLAGDAVVELLVEKKFKWVEGPIWARAHNRLLFSDTQTNIAWQWSAD